MAAVAAAYALGLMSKTMIVTAPALLLLDWWPLRRARVVAPAPADPLPGTAAPADGDAAAARAAPAWRLVAEKLPLFALAAVAGWWSVVL